MRPGPSPLFSTSTAPTTNILPWWLRPPPVTGSFLLRQTISVSSTSTRPASGLRPGASMPQRSLAQISHAVLGAEGELALQLQSRDAVGVGGHQISGPEPGGQRQLGVMHDGSGSDRGLAPAAGALVGPGLGFQSPGFATTASSGRQTRPASAPRQGIERRRPR